jgi:hypothetical protein
MTGRIAVVHQFVLAGSDPGHKQLAEGEDHAQDQQVEQPVPRAALGDTYYGLQLGATPDHHEQDGGSHDLQDTFEAVPGQGLPVLLEQLLQPATSILHHCRALQQGLLGLGLALLLPLQLYFTVGAMADEGQEHYHQPQNARLGQNVVDVHPQQRPRHDRWQSQQHQLIVHQGKSFPVLFPEIDYARRNAPPEHQQVGVLHRSLDVQLEKYLQANSYYGSSPHPSKLGYCYENSQRHYTRQLQRPEVQLYMLHNNCT